MPLLRCLDPECEHEWFERSQLAEGADCEECGGPAVLVDRDDDPDDPEVLEETSTKASGHHAGSRFAFSRKAAQALLRKHKIDHLPVDDIARQEGLAVVERDSLGDNIRGRLVGDVIEVASGDSAVVKRFSVAHELGHHSMGTVHNQGRAEEQEANVFANELLVPRDKLQEHLKHTTNVRELARDFFVSKQVIEIATGQLNKGRGR